MLLCTWKQFSSARDSVGTVTNARKYICDATRERRGIWGVVIRARSQISPKTAQRKSKVAFLSLVMGDKRRNTSSSVITPENWECLKDVFWGPLVGSGAAGSWRSCCPTTAGLVVRAKAQDWHSGGSGLSRVVGWQRARWVLPHDCRDWLTPAGCVTCHRVCVTLQPGCQEVSQVLFLLWLHKSHFWMIHHPKVLLQNQRDQ